MAINRTYFFDEVRHSLFGGSLDQGQVDGLTILLDEGEAREWDWRWIAYLLATAYHETGQTMQPIEEWGKGEGHSYGEPDPETGQTYYGRGYVQLTWADNYKKMSDICDVDMYHDASLALDPVTACKVIYEGMSRGTFTGVELDDYFTADSTDWVNARKIVNALDRAEDIAAYANDFHHALSWTPETLEA